MKGRALQEKGERGQWREREGMKRQGEREKGWRAESRDKQQERFPHVYRVGYKRTPGHCATTSWRPLLEEKIMCSYCTELRLFFLPIHACYYNVSN